MSAHDWSWLAAGVFAIAALLALVLTPLAGRVAMRLGIVDRPGGRRVHVADVPLGGGVAMLLAFLVPLALVFGRLDARYWAILAGATACTALGLLDDRRHLDAGVKLAGQIVIAAIPVAAGIRINHLTVPLLQPVTLGAAAYLVTLIWIVALMNVLNFVDGMDGLAAGLGAIASATFAVLALSLDRGLPAVVAAALAGACIGFLRHNFHPARIFMGDAGSMMIGFVLATVSVQGVLKTTAAVALAFPLLILFVPIFDTSFVVAKRLKHGQRPWQADRNHLHHRFSAIGFSQRRAALLLYAWCLALAGFALAVRFVHYRAHGDWSVGATAVLAALALLALVFTLYVVYVLEILKQRHVQLFGFGRRNGVPGETPLVVAVRERRERRRGETPRRVASKS